MKHRIFIGSSVESLEIAKAIQIELDRFAYVTIWHQDIFKLSSNALDDLVKATTKFDFAIFIFNPDDITTIRKTDYPTVRDNVLFELGLFTGKFGDKKYVFMLKPRSVKELHIASDLAGITLGEYDDQRTDGNFQAMVAPFCDQVRRQIKDLKSNGMLSLEGKWSERWWAEDKENRPIYFEEKEVTIEQFGNEIRAQFNFNNRTYLFEGVIEQMRFITGSWRDIENGPTYSGAFQLIVNIDGKTLYGKWIGFSASSNEIKYGMWEWKREDVDKYPSEYK